MEKLSLELAETTSDELNGRHTWSPCLSQELVASPARVVLLRPPQALAGLFAETGGGGVTCLMHSVTRMLACSHTTSGRAHAGGWGSRVSVTHLPRLALNGGPLPLPSPPLPAPGHGLSGARR